MPPRWCGEATNSCSMCGIQPSAVAPTSAPSGSMGTSRQPSTVSPSSTAMASTSSRAAARATASCGRKQMPAAKVLAPSAAGGGSSKPTTSRNSSTGSWIRMPAPSPLLGSAPAAPRCSRCSKATSPSTTMACERRPWISVIMATPQESDSLSGSYKPLGFGECRIKHRGRHLRSPGKSCPGTAPARIAIVSAQSAELPVEKRRDQREPGQITYHRPGEGDGDDDGGGDRCHPWPSAAPAQQNPCQQ